MGSICSIIVIDEMRIYCSLSPRDTGYYPDRSSSLSRVSSSFGDFQVYNMQQRPWQSNPDLRLEKWTKPSQLCLPAPDDSLNFIDVVKKKQDFLSELFNERSEENESYRYAELSEQSQNCLSSRKESRNTSLIFVGNNCRIFK